MSKSKPNAIDYIEIPSRDLAKSQAFFEELFGWRFTSHGNEYVAFEDGRINGGFYFSDRVSLTSEGATLVVLYTESLAKAKADVLHLGAELTKDTFSFPGGRRFQFTEPGGSEFAFWSDK